MVVIAKLLLNRITDLQMPAIPPTCLLPAVGVGVYANFDYWVNGGRLEGSDRRKRFHRLRVYSLLNFGTLYRKFIGLLWIAWTWHKYRF